MFRKEMKLIDDVEAMVTMRAFTFTHEIGLSSIIIKGDSNVVINTLEVGDESFATHGHMFASTKSLTETC